MHKSNLPSHQICTRCTLKNRNTNTFQTRHTKNAVLTRSVTPVLCTEHSPAQCPKHRRTHCPALSLQDSWLLACLVRESVGIHTCCYKAVIPGNFSNTLGLNIKKSRACPEDRKATLAHCGPLQKVAASAVPLTCPLECNTKQMNNQVHVQYTGGCVTTIRRCSTRRNTDAAEKMRTLQVDAYRRLVRSPGVRTRLGVECMVHIMRWSHGGSSHLVSRPKRRRLHP